MKPLALMIATSPVAREVLEAEGWDVLEADRSLAPAVQIPRPIELWVVGLLADGFAEGLRKLAAIRANAPDLRMVVIAPVLRDAAGQALTDVLLDVPIIRCGFERELLRGAVAAA